MVDSDRQFLCTVTCIKLLMILINIVFWVCGLSLIFIGLWLQTEFNNYLEISTQYSIYPSYTLIVFGVVIIFVACISCTCVVKTERHILVAYGIFLIMMVLSLIGLSLYVHAYKGRVMKGLSKGFRREMSGYDANRLNSKTALIDYIQENLHCCGDESYADWVGGKAPQSCSTRNAGAGLVVGKAEKSIHKMGCTGELGAIIGINLNSIGIMVSIIALLPLIGAVLVLKLAQTVNKVAYEVII